MAYQMTVYRSEDQVESMIEDCEFIINDEGTRFSGMSYEEGIKTALEWLIRQPGVDIDDYHPLEA